MDGHLRGAQIRVGRAREHLEALRRRIDQYEMSQVERVSYDFDPTTKDVRIEMAPTDLPPPGIGLLVGEVIQNLRAALDYTVWELAFLNVGVEVKGTQFPIEDSEEVFTTRREPVYLKGLRTEQVAAIRVLQPFSGCHWTKRLRDLSNPDKHRHLVLLDYHRASSLKLTAGEPGAVADGDRGAVFETTDPHGRPMNMNVQLDLAGLVAFSDGSGVLETLAQLCADVADALRVLDPSGGSGPSRVA